MCFAWHSTMIATHAGTKYWAIKRFLSARWPRLDNLPVRLHGPIYRHFDSLTALDKKLNHKQNLPADGNMKMALRKQTCWWHGMQKGRTDQYVPFAS